MPEKQTLALSILVNDLRGILEKIGQSYLELVEQLF
jgi:hypothetical protein